jgi:FtsP/CotA-like multicopper oxidase with cupredoxin domain
MLASTLARPAWASTELALAPGPAKVRLGGAQSAEVNAWIYNGSVPGPELRVRQGERVSIAVSNGLTGETTVHFHGIRLPNAMDGVPHLTQAPIRPGQTFRYDFTVPDAGTYWYHSHQMSAEQLARGLYGAFIVEEREPVRVDRDQVWLLSDWRLGRDGQISDDFHNMRDMAHNGRVGDIVTVNGAVREAFGVRAGERIRLRLINAANARIFGLAFTGHRPMIVAYDGHPVEPHEPPGGRVILGPGMRVDLILDMTGAPGQRFQVRDTFYRSLEYGLLDLAYAATPLREAPLTDPITLPAGAVPEPALGSAIRHEIRLNGGMMGMMMMRDRGMAGGNMMEMMQSGKIWFINGVATLDHVMEPMLTLARGRTYVLALANETMWWHPMHLHGHAFRVIRRNGAPTARREWQDTVLMAPQETVEIAFVADNPGDWMLHCHVLEHQESGMMGVIRVSA